jgi:hypothetical protein
LVALEIFGNEGNTACQLITPDDPELTGAGAIQVVFTGRADKPDTILLAADEAVFELAALVAGNDDCDAAIDEGELLEPPPLPPQETRNIKVGITNNVFTQFFMVITSPSNTS